MSLPAFVFQDSDRPATDLREYSGLRSAAAFRLLQFDRQVEQYTVVDFRRSKFGGSVSPIVAFRSAKEAVTYGSFAERLVICYPTLVRSQKDFPYKLSAKAANTYASFAERKATIVFTYLSLRRVAHQRCDGEVIGVAAVLNPGDHSVSFGLRMMLVQFPAALDLVNGNREGNDPGGESMPVS